MTDKPKTQTHDELVDECMRYLHDALLQGGARRMRTELKMVVFHLHREWLVENNIMVRKT